MTHQPYRSLAQQCANSLTHQQRLAAALLIPALVAATLAAADVVPTRVDKAFQRVQTPSAIRQEFDIPAGPLAPGLDRFVRESGMNVVYDATVTKGVRTMGVTGRYPPELALRVLLGCTGIDPHFASSGAVTLERVISLEPVIFQHVDNSIR